MSGSIIGSSMVGYRALSTTVGKLLFSSGKSVLSFEVPVMYGIEYEASAYD